ncbi:ATPase domain-containing protein [Archangium lansingense]|uniref:non-specific serine/threonine protein kinase n=1 Tax=Archangium lansingense TaxID=2995310 RepID=A0ABT4AQP0_9BACT|nr:ATPase domain-containing protein [Archangium lansinium]MCY1083107.1 Circadian clock protein KaiC [Archangium lansinium]
MSESTVERPQERIPTGVPGLDIVLHGGLLRGGVYMLQGRPGAGKTILTNQMCFHHAAQGGRVLYSTLLAETHERLLFNLEPLSFFDTSRIPEQIAYLSAFSTLEQGGLKGLVEVLRREARARKSTLLVVDGLVTAEESAQSKREFKKFIHELQIHANLVGCTILLLTSSSAEPVGPEHTMVDGVLELFDNRLGRRAERELEVRKFRGSSYLRGGHAFQITQDGIVVHPRIEALLQNPSRQDPCKRERVSTGVAQLDKMLNGGLPCASTSVLFGPTGAGKTTFGLHFLDESSKSEPGLLFGFYETPPRLLLKAKALGLGLEKKQQQGVFDMMWHSPTERILDGLGNKLLQAVRERGVKRLFIDGVDGFQQSAAYPERISHFLAALTNELRVLGVTTLYTSELQEMFSQQVILPISGISSLVENIFFLRFVELHSKLHRMLSVVKMRDSDYDSSLQEYRITSRGITLAAETFQGAQSVLTGDAKPATRPRRKGLLKKRSR